MGSSCFGYSSNSLQTHYIMNSKILLHFIILLATFYSCDRPNHERDIKTIAYDSDKIINLSDLFKEVKIIPLETTNSSLCGLVIMRIEEYKGKIYLLNRLASHANVLCFDLSGKLLFSIDKLGKGPGEYTYLGDIFIDDVGEYLILVSENNRYLYFDLDGNYLFDVSASDRYYDRSILPLNDSLWVAYNDPETIPEGYDLLFLEKSTFNIKHQIRSTTPVTYRSGRPVDVYNDSIFYFVNNDTIYYVKDFYDKKPWYYVDFGEEQRKCQFELLQMIQLDRDKTLEKAHKFVKERKLRPISYFSQNDKYCVVSYFENDKHTDKGDHKCHFLTYDKHTGQTYRSDKINFDILNSVIIDDIQVFRCCNNVFYGLIHTVFSQDELKKIAKSKYLPATIQQSFLNRKEDDNPILIIFK